MTEAMTFSEAVDWLAEQMPLIPTSSDETFSKEMEHAGIPWNITRDGDRERHDWIAAVTFKAFASWKCSFFRFHVTHDDEEAAKIIEAVQERGGDFYRTAFGVLVGLRGGLFERLGWRLRFGGEDLKDHIREAEAEFGKMILTSNLRRRYGQK